jgi:hypothetical protein
VADQRYYTPAPPKRFLPEVDLNSPTAGKSAVAPKPSAAAPSTTPSAAPAAAGGKGKAPPGKEKAGDAKPVAAPPDKSAAAKPADVKPDKAQPGKAGPPAPPKQQQAPQLSAAEKKAAVDSFWAHYQAGLRLPVPAPPRTGFAQPEERVALPGTEVAAAADAKGKGKKK